MTVQMVSKDIADYLKLAIGEGGGGFTDVFPFEWGKAGDPPAELESQTLVEDSPGSASLVGDSYEQVVFSITIRGTSDEAGATVYDRAKLIHDFLIQSKRVTINTSEYAYFEPFAALQAIGPDKKGRPLIFAKYFSYRNV